MSELPYAIQLAVNKYEPIEFGGMKFYPIRVNEYDAFLTARPGIEVMQQALPVSLVSLPLLEALYRLDYDAVSEGRETSGLFQRALLFLSLSLRLGEGMELNDRLRRFRIIVDRENASKLKAVRFTLNGEETFDITPVQFARLRPILAAQNGVRLEADDANPELVQAERDIQSLNTPELELRMEDLISSVALISGKDEAEIYDWPILKLDRRKEAAARLIDYITCSINEGAGCKWKGGNPVPSIWFNKIRSSSALVALSDFANGAGSKAVSNPGQQVF